MNITQDNRSQNGKIFTTGKVDNFHPSVKCKSPFQKKPFKEDQKSVLKKHISKKSPPRKERTNSSKHYSNLLVESAYGDKIKTKNTTSFEILRSSKEMPRPSSLINKTFINHLELAQKVKSIKRYSNPSIIDKLIKRSLLKAKSSKAHKEKELKQSYLQNEIRKRELSYQNRQIRIQNSAKSSKKHKRKSRIPKTHTPSHTHTLITDNSNKIKKSESISLKHEKRNLRSNHFSDMTDLKSSKIKNTPSPARLANKENKGLQKIEEYKKSLEEYMKSYQQNSRHQSESSVQSCSFIENYENSVDNSLGQPNFSFVYEGNLENSIYKEKFDTESDDFSEKISKSADVSVKKESSGEILIELNDKENNVKCIEWDIETFSGISIKKPQKNQIFSFEKGLNYHIKPQKVRKNCQVTRSEKVLCMPQEKLRNLQIIASQVCSIQSEPSQKFQMSIESTVGIEVFATKTQESPYKIIAIEEFSWSNTQIFLLEQLKLLELSSISDLSRLLPLETQTRLIYEIEQKYSSLLSFLRPQIDSRIKFLTNDLSKSECANFILSTQKKKQSLHKLINETMNSSQNPSMKMFPTSKTSENDSSSNSSSDSESYKSSITHSRSVKHLHESEYENAPNSPKAVNETQGQIMKNIEKPHIIEDDDKKIIPKLNLALEPVEYEITDSRQCFSFEYIKEYIENVMQNVDRDKLMKILALPLMKDPLEELDKLQDLQIGSFTDLEIRYFHDLISCERLLANETLAANNENKDLQVLQAEKIHKKMLLHSLNYLLQQFRPYGYKGKPLPWYQTFKNRPFKAKFEEITEKVLKDFEKLSKFAIGKTEDFDSSLYEDENMILKIKEQQLDKLVRYEISEEESKWVNYDFEEAQVKLDLADMILYDLAVEAIKINE
ncbi:hypothetical protein SteCoe_23101 [Stentor coeruleus]|uniref:DUF4378 domain-containing protein n=1 Tax=Stentor coeruleus TaxID=5963 RepID=A0A1R2BKQ9_9CILI|nr:hypothetical protein SteCoe_23101 [Stentor coeruleus]